MSPIPNSLFFSPETLQFSYRQKYIQQYYENQKTGKLKGRLHDISLSKTLSKSLSRSQVRSPSPRSRNLKTKDYVGEAGLTIIESQILGRISNR
jgi:hypothetical protein